jgi:hypothetical protein
MYALEIGLELSEAEADVIVAAFEKVRANERERIIALLEALDTEQWCGTNLQIIALIKGEKE